jgi:hypothetical protein
LEWVPVSAFQGSQVTNDQRNLLTDPLVAANYVPMLEFVIGYSAGTQGQARAASMARSMEAAQGSKHSERVEQVNEKVENLGLIIRAMWSLLEDNGYTGEQLMDRIEKIQAQERAELLDGVPAATRCANCNSMVANGLPNCQYCGSAMPKGDRHPLDDL